MTHESAVGRSAAALICMSHLLLAAGCASEEDDPRRAVVEKYADIVLATYEDSLTTARALDAAVDALVASPSEEALIAARERWRAARIPYGYSEAFRFYGGPIDGPGGPEGRLNGWPLDENHLDAVHTPGYNAAPGLDIIGNPRAFPSITPELIAAQNEAGGEKNIASGYHAIEFLLWGQDLNDPPESAGQRPYTDFVVGDDSPDTRNARRGQYLKAATTLLIADLERVAEQWQVPKTGQHNYRSRFVAGDVSIGLQRMVTGLAALAEVEMAGERMQVPLLSSDQEEEQSCFSDTTAEDLRANAAGIEHVYYGKYARLDGTVVSGANLSDLLAKSDLRTAQDVDTHLARTREALAAIRSPFDREIHSDNERGQARILAAIEALRAQAASLTRAAASIRIELSDLHGLAD